jgi:Na+/H+-translocating membrane pyrophosphatase
MQNYIANTLKVFTIVCVLIFAVIAILLVLDVGSNQEVKEALNKGLLISGILSLAFIAVAFIANLSKKD